ncbi:glutathione S-transferase N-terminal domain-containing protein [Sphingomonas sp. CGMCC 1.13654]|uniref:Glutathione S-transferase N-terminal domain-containing protein n=1 Tax=Sphingomonas chungangi TaxID=2683589 RepID=A0A838L7G1_9SPHN|nr:glutathione S-transferase N-terminal domain-containing protein [Sphingomonas chungangi]MBA2934957.1 glutathione S-transferase N-terminal domain-containing protein [Sphingomonas chungangi]MVW58268.1 glutathione S-transferase family protein [Sphingomonas chungangi]
MLVLHTWTTPNGKKVPILLEELGLSYEIHFVNIGKDEQFEPEFLAISPNNKVPALVDHGAEGGPLSIFESGAILTYLADKHHKFLAPSGHSRWKSQEWLYWQIGSLGPMLGQLGFFAVRSKEKAPLAIDRFTEECGRLLGVMERRLAKCPYLAGEEYTIADVACYPWMVGATTMLKDALGEHLDKKPAIDRWMQEIGGRPAVQRGMAIKPPAGI